ncbi:MAG: sensor histidine kinase [Tissierellaceae bacterium]|nr:sensor histidine kinase [Tissierellaceae bacterium]
MQGRQIGIKRLNEILETTVKTITESKDEVFEIVSFSRSDYKRLEEELNLLQSKVRDILVEVERLEVLDRRSRNNLSIKSKNFDQYTEQDIRDAYDLANETRIQLALKREEEKNLLLRRKELEIRLRNAYDIFKRAEKLNKQISVAAEYLMGNVDNIVETVDELSKKHYLGIKIIEAQEEERLRVARDIHDGPAQSLANVIVKAELCEKLINIDVERTKKELSNLRSVIRSTLGDVRKIIYDLRPMSLDDLGLVPTLEKHISIFQEDTGIEVNFKTIGSLNNLESAMQIALFRITQESLSNIWKHSKANSVSIILEKSIEKINLSISDNGIGFDLENYKIDHNSVSKGFGLMSIKERVELLEGVFNITSSRDYGTKLTLSLPLREES